MAIRATLVSIILLFLMPAHAGEAPLTSAGVEHWIRTEIEVVELQNEFKANAGQYEDLPVAFAAARKKLVVARGYGSDEAFDAVGDRIFAALNAMEEQVRLDKERAERAAGPGEAEKDAAALAEMEEMLGEIENNPYLTPEQKEKMIAATKEAMGVTVEHDTEAMQDEVEARTQAAIDATRPDWPAVEPWVDTLNHLTSWAAGNRPDAPVLD